MKIMHLEESEIGELNSLLENYEYDPYIKISLFNKKQAKNYLFDRLISFYLKNKDTTLVAKDGNKIVGLIGYNKLDWDTKHFGFNIANLSYLIVEKQLYHEDIKIKSELLNFFSDWCIKESIKFVSAKIDAKDYSTIHALESFGFNYISTVLTPLLDCRNLKDFKKTLNLRNAKKDEVELIAKIAEEVLEENRFILDKGFDEQKSRKLHGEWVRNKYKNNPENLYVLENDSEIIGFYIVTIEDISKYFGLKVAYLDLAGISKKYIGKGYGIPLYTEMLNVLKSKGDIVYTDFIAQNLPVFSIYTSLGFKFSYSKIAMHKWFY